MRSVRAVLERRLFSEIPQMARHSAANRTTSFLLNANDLQTIRVSSTDDAVKFFFGNLHELFDLNSQLMVLAGFTWGVIKRKAMRVGSVVAKADIELTPRPYADHQAYCLFFTDGGCGKCIDRCPVRAITEAGHDKEKCRQHLIRSKAHVEKTYKFEGDDACGLCQVGVPCEAGIPVKAVRDALKRGELPPSLA